MKRRGFTLIELLVVIAIIAILAAILFPVFAQAKVAAKKAVDLSNVKQISLGVIMYAADFDDYTPGVTNGGDTWVVVTFPYIKSGAVTEFLPGAATAGLFRSPLDANGTPSAIAFGTAISYGVNSLFDNTFTPRGMFSFSGNNARSFTSVTNPADTVMMADKFNADVFSYLQSHPFWGGIGFGNHSRDPFSPVFTGPDFAMISGRGDHNIPNGTLPAQSNTVRYPTGSNGGVSLVTNNQANFAFSDGHTKTMNPGATNPDPINQPLRNMWNAER